MFVVDSRVTVFAPSRLRVETARRSVGSQSASDDRISGLNGDFEWHRTRINGINRARAWSGLGIFNHNLVKISLETPLSVTLCSAAIWHLVSCRDLAHF